MRWRGAYSFASSRHLVLAGTRTIRRSRRENGLRLQSDTAMAQKRSGAQDGAEPVGEGGDDPAAQLARLLVRQCPLRRAEGDPECEGPLALADLLAPVLVEDRERPQRRPRRLADRVGEV